MVGWVIGGRESMALEEVECAVSLSYVQAHRAAANTLADLITRTKASQSHQVTLIPSSPELHSLIPPTCPGWQSASKREEASRNAKPTP